MSTQFTNRQWRLPNNENKDKQSNYSMDFDGSSQYIQLNSSVLLPNQHTISTWIKSDDLTSSGVGYLFTTEGTIKGIGLDEGSGPSGAGKFYYWNGSVNIISTTAITVNNWHHIVFVFDSTANEIKFYLDGNLDKTTTVSIGTAGNIKTIGSYAGSLHYLNGKLDAFSIYNYALSSSQITTLYGSSSTGIGNPMSLSPKPVFYAPLGDQDSFNGAEYLVPNSSLKDYVFDFIPNDYIDCGNDSSLQITGDLSISAWFKIDNSSSNSYFNIITKWISGDSAWSSYVTKSTGILSFWISTNGSSQSQINSTTNVNDGNWHHFLGINDGTNIKLYIDGNLEDTGTGGTIYNSTQNVLIGKTNQNSFLFSGELSNVQIFNTALTDGTGGTVNQIETLYNNGSPLTSMSGFTSLQGWWKLDASATYDGSNWTIEDSSSNSNDGTSSGMTQANLVQSDLSFTSGYSPYALSFDGANDYIDCGNDSSLQITGDLTLSAWVNIGTSTSIMRLINKDNGSNRAWIMLIVSGKIRFTRFYTASSLYYMDSSISVNDSNWHHIACVNDSTGTAKIYIDGVEDTASTGTNTGTVLHNASVTLKLGGDFYSQYLNGSLSNVSIWNAALTSAQVTEIYNEGVPSNLNNHSAYSNLVSWWQLGSNSSFNTNWTVLDEKGSNNGTSSNMTENDIVDGVGSYANGLSSGMGGDEVIGDAPYSSSNSLSVNMDVLDRTEDTPS
jgi:hypothetical protein